MEKVGTFKTRVTELENKVQILKDEKKVKEEKVVTLHAIIAYKEKSINGLNLIIQEGRAIKKETKLENEKLNSSLSVVIQKVPSKYHLAIAKCILWDQVISQLNHFKYHLEFL